MTKTIQKSAYDLFQEIKYYPNLDGLRAISIILVMMFHVSFASYSLWVPRYVMKNGHQGVSLFFIISGFLICRLLIKEKKVTGAINLTQFYIRRGLRLYPLYYAIFFLYCILIFKFHLYEDSFATLLQKDFFYYLFYLSNFLKLTGPLIFFWSLAAEEQFYLVFGFIKKYVSLSFILIGACSLVLFKLFVVYHFFNVTLESHLLFRILFSYHLPILFGVILAIVVENKRNFNFLHALSKYQSLCWIIIIGMYLLMNLESPKEAVYFVDGLLSGVSTFIFNILLTLLVFFSVTNQPSRFLEHRGMVHLGKISYGMYLMHMLCINFVSKLAVFNITPIFLFLLSFGLCVIVSSISYYCYETPFLKLKARFSYHYQKKKETKETVVSVQ